MFYYINETIHQLESNSPYFSDFFDTQPCFVLDNIRKCICIFTEHTIIIPIAIIAEYNTYDSCQKCVMLHWNKAECNGFTRIEMEYIGIPHSGIGIVLVSVYHCRCEPYNLWLITKQHICFGKKSPQIQRILISNDTFKCFMVLTYNVKYSTGCKMIGWGFLAHLLKKLL